MWYVIGNIPQKYCKGLTLSRHQQLKMFLKQFHVAVIFRFVFSQKTALSQPSVSVANQYVFTKWTAFVYSFIHSFIYLLVEWIECALSWVNARIRVWTRDTVLDGHGGVCVMTYRPVSSTFSLKRGFNIPHIYTAFGSRSFSVAASQACNHFPADIRRFSTISTFKRHLKTYLFMIAYSQLT